MKNLLNNFTTYLFLIVGSFFLNIKIGCCQQLLAEIQPSSTKCTHGTDGMLTAQPTGGTAPYSYQWNTGSNTQTINNLSVGNYSVIVTDNAGATFTATYELYSCCTGTYLIEGDVQLSSLIGSPFAIQNSGDAYVFTNFNCNPGLAYNTIALNGTLHIDMNCYFLNLELICGPDAEIIVDPSVSLKFTDGCNYVHGCSGKMWKGITLAGNQAGQYSFVNGAESWIEDAQQAVVSNNDAEFYINDVTFNKNYKAIVVNGTGNSNASVINNTTFSCNVLNTNGTLGSTAFCLFPNSGKRSFKGVELISVGGFTVGYTGFLNQPNTFRNLDYGIYLDSRFVSSGVTVVNNHFVDMPFVTNTCDNGWGVWSTSAVGFSAFVISTLNIGGNLPYQPNTFTDCHGGVFSTGNTHATVSYNSFTRCPDNTPTPPTNFNANGAAVRFRIADRPSTLDIFNNDLNNCNRGIQVLNFQNSPVTISFNTINNPPNNIWNTFGISLVNVLPAHGSGSTFINDNIINYCKTGITLTNSKRTNVGPNNYVGYNFNNNPSPIANPRYGVRLQASSLESRVFTNTIERIGSVNPNSTFESKFFGISVESSDGNLVSSNEITRMGDAISYFNGI